MSRIARSSSFETKYGRDGEAAWPGDHVEFTGQDTPLHVFPVLPVSATVEVGRVAMPKADLPMVVHDQNRRLQGFIRSLVLS